MSSNLAIRAEQPADCAGIHQVTELAFRDRPYADGDEQEVVARLRASGALTLSLVAIDQGELVGQVSFSPATLDDSSHPWFALGPVSVAPKRQGQGIGSRLIEQGLAQITELGALGCILTGNPNYYQRFGFRPCPDNAATSEPAEYFMLKLLSSSQPPQGRFAFHPAFYG